MAKRKSITKKTRFEVFKRDSFTCLYCGRSAPEVILQVDHIHPVSKGGEHDLLNYSTACLECNQGKKDRLLTDNSVITKQKAQLDELQERREQLEMMIAWRDGLTNLEDMSLGAAGSEWERLTGWGLNDGGISDLKKLVRKWGLNAVLEAMSRASVYLEVKKGTACTTESFNIAFNKIGGICKMMSLPEWKQEIYHIRNIARKRMHWGCSDTGAAELLHELERAYHAGVPLSHLREIAIYGYNLSQIWQPIADAIKEAQSG